MEEARSLLVVGEPLVSAIAEEHGKFICVKGEVALLAGKSDGAIQALEQARSFADRLQVGPSSELIVSIQRLEGLIDRQNSGLSSEHNLREMTTLEGRRLMEEGNAHNTRANYAEAERLLSDSLTIFRRIGNQQFEAKALANLALVKHNQSCLEEAADFYSQALQLAEAIGDQRNIGIFTGSLALIYQDLGKIQTAQKLYKRALDVARQLGDHRSVAVHLGNFAMTFAQLGQLERAVPLLKQAYESAAAVGDRAFESINLGNFGDIAYQLGQIDTAETALVRAIDLGDQTMPIVAGAFRGSLALIHARRDGFQSAFDLLETGAKQVENHPLEKARLLAKRARIEMWNDQLDDAQRSLGAAQQIADEFGLTDRVDLPPILHALEADIASSLNGNPPAKSSPNTTWGPIDSEMARDDEPLLTPSLRAQNIDLQETADAFTSRDDLLDALDDDFENTEEFDVEVLRAHRLRELGNIEQDQSNRAEAQAYYEQALAIYRHNEMKHEEAVTLGNLAGCLRAQGKLPEALAHFQAALKQLDSDNSGVNGAIFRSGLGNVYRDLGRLDEAIENFRVALDLHQAIGDRKREAEVLSNLGLVCHSKGALDEALAYLTNAIEISIEVGAAMLQATCLGNLGLVCLDLGKYEEAARHCNDASDLFRSRNNLAGAGICRGNFGEALFRQGKLRKALPALQDAIDTCMSVYPQAVGVFRGSKALVLAELGEFDAAFTSLEAGADAVKHSPEEFANFLIKQATVQDLAGQKDAALTTFEHARDVVTSLPLNPSSPVLQKLNNLAERLGQHKSSGSDRQ